MLVKQPGKGENHRTLYQQLTYAACTGCCVALWSSRVRAGQWINGLSIVIKRATCATAGTLDSGLEKV